MRSKGSVGGEMARVDIVSGTLLDFDGKSRFLRPFLTSGRPGFAFTPAGRENDARRESLITQKARLRRTLSRILHIFRSEWMSSLGNRLLIMTHRRKVRKIGKDVWMDLHIHLSGLEIYVDDAVYIGPCCRLYGKGGIWIGEGTIFGPEVTVLSAMPSYEDPASLPFDAGMGPMPVRIGKGVWVGYGAMLCPGVRVGAGAVIGMGAVVTEDVPSGAVVGGNPARVLRMRDPEIVRSLLREGKFFGRDRARMLRRRRAGLEEGVA
jgi:acetyltransferase-like isoleucine patch superfamily enzyme